MTGRLREQLQFLLRRMSARQPKARRTQRLPVKTEVIKGSVDRVITVRSPVPGVFREAVFFLEDGYLCQRGFSREQLLQQARQIAAEYTAARLPPRTRQPFWPLLRSGAFCSGLTLLLMKLTGGG